MPDWQWRAPKLGYYLFPQRSGKGEVPRSGDGGALLTRMRSGGCALLLRRDLPPQNHLHALIAFDKGRADAGWFAHDFDI
jgi:hypothetical protein